MDELAGESWCWDRLPSWSWIRFPVRFSAWVRLLTVLEYKNLGRKTFCWQSRAPLVPNLRNRMLFRSLANIAPTSLQLMFWKTDRDLFARRCRSVNGIKLRGATTLLTRDRRALCHSQPRSARRAISFCG